MDTFNIIKQTPLFKALSEEMAESLANIALKKRVLRREIIFYEGDPGYSIYVLISGQVQLYKTRPGGKEIVVKMIKEKEMFGEVILFEENSYPVSAVALSDSSLLMLPKHQFSCLLEKPRFREEFITVLMHKMRYLTNQIQYLASYDVEERLFRFFNEHFGKKDKFKIDISKKDIASIINTTPETLSRVLLRLKKENKIDWDESTITIKKG
ncbi:Crp/Fnr family transcriptional regulator [bacterium]|nr:Crp/Fnr family transcriptional regulator [bacterium]